MKSIIYKTIKEKLLAITSADDSPSTLIKHVGLWNRQTEFIEKETAFETPAIFIEFGTVNWRHQLQGIQDTTLDITLHIVTTYAPEGYDGDLLHLDIIDQINKSLHGLENISDKVTTIGPLTRASSTPCHDHEELLVTREVYTTHLTDKSAHQETTIITPPNQPRPRIRVTKQ